MKILIEHLEKNREVLIKYSELISTAKHKNNLGTAREALISAFLKQNLPEYIAYHTGEIFDSKNTQSGQIDIILHPITSPKLNLYNAINLFPAETVLAAIEVKSELTTGDRGELAKALSSCIRVKKLVKYLGESVEFEKGHDFKYIPFIIFAYKGQSKRATINYVNKYFDSWDFSKKHIGYLPDLIVVLSHGKDQESYFLRRKKNWWTARINNEELYIESNPDDTVLLGMFGILIKLIEKWFTNPQLNFMPIDRYIKDYKTLESFFK
jgi:hypothetical protein